MLESRVQLLELEGTFGVIAMRDMGRYSNRKLEHTT